MDLQPASPVPSTSARLLTGQKALVTGANSGIGRSVAIALGQAGADVAVNYVTGEEAANAVVAEILEAGANAFASQADVSREDQVAAMFVETISRFGTLDILVANAGLQRDAAFHEMTLEQWNAVIGVNLTGQFLCARAAIREFLRRGVVETVSAAAGKIICMSSVHQDIPWAGHANYATSKGGIRLLMESMAQEVGATPHSRKRHRARCDPNADQHRSMEHAGRVRRPYEARALRPDRRTGGHRPSRRLARVRPVRLCGWHDAVRRWRDDPLSRLCDRRLIQPGAAPRR